MTRLRLDPAVRRAQLLDVGAELFAATPYDDVRMEQVAERAGVSRALLYRYFPSKRDLLAAIYQQAAGLLLTTASFDPDGPLLGQVLGALDAHLDYFAANQHTVLAANRTLAGDPVIQAVIADELAVLRHRLLDAAGAEGRSRDLMSTALKSWLVLVRALCVDWLADQTLSRAEVREMCVGTLLGALRAVDLDHLLTR